MEKTQTVVAPRPGETRDCLDPWKMSFVHADGAVSLCCWSRPVGNIKDAPFGEILMNEAAREMRRGLLKLRGQYYTLTEDMVLARKHLAGSEAARAALEQHVANLEEERTHLR